MAGIGFELRRLLRTQSYLGLLRTYTYAGIISSGPWVLSILVIMVLGLVSFHHVKPVDQVTQFLVSVTYLVAGSLILTGLVQLLFTRFVADRLYERKPENILPNLISLLSVVNLISGALALAILLWLFTDTPAIYRIEMLAGFVLLCNIWCLSIFLSGIKEYKQILWCFAAGYGVALGVGLALRPWGLEGLLGAFVLGQGILLSSMLYLVLRAYPSDRLAAADLLNPRLTHRSLLLTGLLFNLGIWIDKFIFWFNPATSVHIIGPLRASPIYDFPLFLAYLSIVPGMAVFLVRMETDFAERYEQFYDAVRDGNTLAHIEELRGGMIDTVKQGIYEIFKIQGITVALLILLGPALMSVLGFSELYVPLFNIDIIAVAVQILLLAILNTLFYLDKLVVALSLCLLFALGNCILTLITQYLGVTFYGYGYAVSLILTSLVGLGMLSKEMNSLTYETFMFQPGPEEAKIPDTRIHWVLKLSRLLKMAR